MPNIEPNIDLIKHAVCGKSLGAYNLISWDDEEADSPCRCFIGELLHVAGYEDSELWATGPIVVEGDTYPKLFPKLGSVYGLDADTCEAICQVNDQTDAPERRASEVLRLVFNTTCEEV
jgi:hypothetical protein